MANKLYQEILDNIPSDRKRFYKISMDIVDQIFDYLRQNNLSQKDLAAKLGKKESEISKWMSGNHNFSIKTIAKIEAVLGEDILLVPKFIEQKNQIANTLKSGRSKPGKGSKIIYKPVKQKSMVAEKKVKYKKK